MADNPMSQFQIERYVELNVYGIDASFTNSSMFMVAAVVAVVGFLNIAMSSRSLVPTRLLSIAELSYEFIAGMLRDNVGSEGIKYLPFVFSLFTFVLACNVLGLLPYSFTVTSHIAVTFALAAFVIVVVTMIGFARHGVGYTKLFAPEGVPTVLLILIVPIEIVSYLFRPVSLSVRLFANMMAGHIM